MSELERKMEDIRKKERNKTNVMLAALAASGIVAAYMVTKSANEIKPAENTKTYYAISVPSECLSVENPRIERGATAVTEIQFECIQQNGKKSLYRKQASDETWTRYDFIIKK